MLTTKQQYSCSGLADDNPARYLKAAEVRRQVAEAPGKRIRVAGASGPSARAHLAKYPRTFKNTEELELDSRTPRQEYPVLATGSWNPTQPNTAGNARAIYYNRDRTVFNVAYHDPNKSDDTGKNFSIAPYRPAANARHGEPPK